MYAGVAEPLVAEDIADAIVWMATRPAHVNVDLLVIKPRAQAAPTRCTGSPLRPPPGERRHNRGEREIAPVG